TSPTGNAPSAGKLRNRSSSSAGKPVAWSSRNSAPASSRLSTPPAKAPVPWMPCATTASPTSLGEGAPASAAASPWRPRPRLGGGVRDALQVGAQHRLPGVLAESLQEAALVRRELALLGEPQGEHAARPPAHRERDRGLGACAQPRPLFGEGRRPRVEERGRA